ncbi:gas vesicle protein [Streptomyces sp. NBC_00872]|uniref:gas vesicle protein n=1 Tax=Streptomyces sp. NBC_00872 TaxID=2903686 RepID=UPI00386F2A0D|nr:gas vesicle protein [Streptomyces sp. NBC_00872]
MTDGARPATGPDDRTDALAGRQIALIDLLDRLLTGGVVLTGDLTLSIADVDLVRISLRALIVAVRAEQRPQGTPAERAALERALGPPPGNGP